MVRRRGLIAAGVAAAILLAASAPAQAVSRKVAVGDFRWSPATVTVDLGETVTWNWTGPDTQHSITGLSPNAAGRDSDPDQAAPVHPVGHRFSLRFTAPGSYDFHCKVHAIVRGTVVVTATPGSDAPSPDPDPPLTGDTTPPRLAAVRLTGSGSRRELRWEQDEAGRVTLDLVRVRGAREVLVGTRVVRGHVGYNAVRLPRSLRPRTPGRYRIYLRAADAANNQSRDARTAFGVR